MTTTLYLIGTPLGNLKDMTPRAAETLRQLNHVFAEDTRELFKLMQLLSIPTEGKKVHSFASHNLKKATELALELLQSGQDVGLTTDRGMPSISDPGSTLVTAARQAGFRIIPVPGPSAVTTAMSVAGFASSFLFVGFFPKENKDQNKILDAIEKLGVPLLFFESPQRVGDTLKLLKDRFSHGRVFIGREMTKAFEEYVEVDLSTVENLKMETRGEFTVAVLPTPREVPPASVNDIVDERLMSDKEWSKKVGKALNLSSSELYNALQAKRRERV